MAGGGSWRPRASAVVGCVRVAWQSRQPWKDGALGGSPHSVGVRYGVVARAAGLGGRMGGRISGGGAIAGLQIGVMCHEGP